MLTKGMTSRNGFLRTRKARCENQTRDLIRWPNPRGCSTAHQILTVLPRSGPSWGENGGLAFEIQTSSWIKPKILSGQSFPELLAHLQENSITPCYKGGYSPYSRQRALPRIHQELAPREPPCLPSWPLGLDSGWSHSLNQLGIVRELLGVAELYVLKELQGLARRY